MRVKILPYIDILLATISYYYLPSLDIYYKLFAYLFFVEQKSRHVPPYVYTF